MDAQILIWHNEKMWIIVALVFVILSLHKLAAGDFFGFLVLLAFAGFSVFLYKAGMDIT